MGEPYDTDDLTDHVLAEMDADIAAHGTSALALEPSRVRRLIATIRAERGAYWVMRSRQRAKDEQIIAKLLEMNEKLDAAFLRRFGSERSPEGG